MKISPIRNIGGGVFRPKTNIKAQIPKKVTLDNLPAVAAAIGFVTPIPFAFLIFGAIGKAIQVIAKKFLHKP